MRGLGQRLELNARLDGLLRPALGGNTPSWALGTYWRDFVKDVGILPNPTDTHGQTIYEPDSSGLYLPYAANVLTRTDLGLQTVPTRTNLCLRSQEIDNGAWNTSAGAGSSVTITADYATAPDGALTADRLVFVNAGNFAIRQQLFTVASATVYTMSVWAKTNDGSSKTLTIGDDAVGSGTMNVTGSWQRFTFTYTTASTSGKLQIAGPSCDVSIWQAQYELGAFASPPIVTTSASATVNGNQQVIDLTGRLGTGVAGLVQVNLLGAMNDLERICSFTDGTTSNRLDVYRNGANLVAEMVAATVSQGSVNIVAFPAPGVFTVAFSFGPNFITGRIVGGSNPTPDTVATFPALSQVALAGLGTTSSRNIYAYTRKLALSFGPQDATTFDAMYARAVLAAAA